MARAGELKLTRFADVQEFEGRALPFLMEREAENNLFLGICSQIREGRYTDPYLAVVEAGDEIVAAAFRTPPHQLGLSHVEHIGAIPAIVTDARAAFDALPGVVGAKDAARRFAELWGEETGRRFKVGMEQRIYRATESRPPGEVPGEMREATSEDRDVLISWIRAFRDEAGGILTTAEAVVDDRLSASSSGLVVWWDSDPVSVAGYAGPTPNGIRVGPVYTPPDARGRGYASACVAALTQRLLDAGRRFVFLYTDLANPTSNSIYQGIGYRPVCDVDQYLFDP